MHWELIPAVSAVVAIIVLGIRQEGRTKRLPGIWAADNRFEMLHLERRRFFRGPFFFGSNKADRVYHVAIRDAGCHVRTGYLRCRASFFGIFPDVTDVRWDPVPEEDRRRGFEVIPAASAVKSRHLSEAEP